MIGALLVAAVLVLASAAYGLGVLTRLGIDALVRRVKSSA